MANRMRGVVYPLATHRLALDDEIEVIRLVVTHLYQRHASFQNEFIISVSKFALPTASVQSLTSED